MLIKQMLSDTGQFIAVKVYQASAFLTLTVKTDLVIIMAVATMKSTVHLAKGESFRR